MDLVSNGKPFMALAEFEALVGALGEGLSDELLAKVRKDAEPDSDGQINLRHFCAKMMTKP